MFCRLLSWKKWFSWRQEQTSVPLAATFSEYLHLGSADIGFHEMYPRQLTDIGSTLFMEVHDFIVKAPGL